MRIAVLLLFLTNSIYCQEVISTQNSSARQSANDLLLLKNPGTLDFDNALTLAGEYYDISLDTALLLAEKVVEWTKKAKNDEYCCKAMIYLAEINKFKGDAESSLNILDEVKQLIESTDNVKGKAAISSLYGSISRDRGENEDAISYFIEAADIYESIGDNKALAETYGKISGVFFNTNQLEKFQKYNIKIAELAEALDDDELRVDAGGSSAIYLMTKGIHYYLNNQLDTANMQQTMDTLNAYFVKSENKYDETIIIARKFNNKKILLTLINNMVALANNMEKIERSEKLAFEAKSIAEDIESNDLLVQSKINLASVLMRRKKYEEALRYGKEALATAKEFNLDRKITLANMRLYDLYVEMGSFQEALQVGDEIRAYELKLSNVEKAKAIAEIETKYETIKKENQIQQLESNNDRIKSQRNYLLGGGLILALLAFFGIRLNRLIKDRNDKKEFTNALMLAQEEERKKIARDLHDGIGQSLLLIKKQMEKSNETTAINQEMISETLEEVRSLSRDLHPFQLEKFGLTATIEEMIQKVQTNTNLFISKDITNIDEYISKSSSIHIFRTVQEALSNIIKHAEATAAKVTIEIEQESILVTIMDNGKGFDTELTVAKSKSLGLKTMNERMAAIDARFNIENGDNNGTVVSLIIPKKVS